MLAKFLLRKTRYVDKAVWIINDWSSGFFHWMTESLPRLEACADFMNGHAVLLPGAYSKIRFVQESLTLLQVPIIYYDMAVPLSVNEMLVPSHTAPTGNYNEKFIHRLRGRLIPRRASNEKVSSGSNRIYISRRKAERRRLTNENEVGAILRKFGFKAHCMEDYCLVDQIEIMSKAEMLVGLHGAGLTNMMFMRPQSKILEIRNYEDNHNNCYFALASEFGHRYFYIQSESKNKNTQTASFTVNLGTLTSALRLLTGDP
jgi:capsular polysaccharide biosynthesis protein